LRREAPVYRARMSYAGDAEFYLLARYRDCVDLTTDHRFRRVVEGSEPVPMPKALRFMSTEMMIQQDDPAHMRLRKLVSRAFTPRSVTRLRLLTTGGLAARSSLIDMVCQKRRPPNGRRKELDRRMPSSAAMFGTDSAMSSLGRQNSSLRITATQRDCVATGMTAIRWLTFNAPAELTPKFPDGRWAKG
jgi:hypothetical protein